jgi:hypothetical protein
MSAALTEDKRDAARYRAIRSWPYAQSKLVAEWPQWGPGTEFPEAADVVDAKVDWYINSAMENRNV